MIKEFHVQNRRFAIWLDEMPDACIRLCTKTRSEMSATDTGLIPRRVAIEFEIGACKPYYALLGGTAEPGPNGVLNVSMVTGSDVARFKSRLSRWGGIDPTVGLPAE